VSIGERRYVPLSQLNWLVITGAFLVFAVLIFLYKYLDFVAHGVPVRPVIPFLEEITGVFAAQFVFPIAYLVATRYPLIGVGWWRNVPIHIASVVGTSLLHTSLMAISRRALWPILGLGHYNYGYMPVTYLMEFANYVIVYCTVVAVIYLYYEIRHAGEREVAKAQLEAHLSEAKLQNLRLQLHPHFLFNALNAISAVVYENPRVADEMIGRLSELLRAVLRNDRSPEVRLAQELELLALYTSVMSARFEKQLTVDIDASADVRDCLVPQLLLQPLVENSIRHGVDPQTFQIHVSVQAERNNGAIQITVRDRGPGFAPNHSASGIGLRNTMERLQGLYGAHQQILWHNHPSKGAVVQVRLPFHTEPVSGAVL
jgi:signal transduction histidine kinase